MRKSITIFLFLLSFLSTAHAEKGIEIEYPSFLILSDSAELKITVIDAKLEEVLTISSTEGYSGSIELTSKLMFVKVPLRKSADFKFKAGEFEKEVHLRKIPGWFSILPPLIAIALALVFKEVILSLFTGIFVGALAMYGFSPAGFVKAFFAAIQHFFFVALSDSGNISVIIFSVAIGGMVSVISRNGGMHGIVDKLSLFAHSARSAQLVTWFMGIAIFFDDYANTLIVGNTMRPVTDRFNVSREKLAYIVDSTAAPVAALAFITTWIGAELGYISKASESLGINEGAYSLFLNSLQYAYYPLFTLVFMFLLLWKQKDFGPMWKAETRSRNAGNFDSIQKETLENEYFKPIDISKAKWYNGLLPVLTVVLVTIFGLVFTGLDSISQMFKAENSISANDGFNQVWANLYLLSDSESIGLFRKLGIIIGESDAYLSLIWASFSGIALAIALTVSQRIMTINNTMETLIEGFKTMVPAMLILILAWSLTEVTSELKTAIFITEIFKGHINPIFMPAVTFFLAAIIAFSTGSSWGTMAILYPLALPATWVLCQESGIPQEESMSIFYHVISVVLAGSVFGDHCSPISDTTILSSLASQCSHVEHVRTQLPYALTVGLISILISVFAHLSAIHWIFLYGGGIGFIFIVIHFYGKKIETGIES